MNPGATILPPASITTAPCGRQVRGDRDDPLALDAHVGLEARRTAAVDDGAASQQQRRAIGAVFPEGIASSDQKKGADRAGDAIASSTVNRTRHLSNVVHGCEMPQPIRSPTCGGSASSAPAAQVRVLVVHAAIVQPAVTGCGAPRPGAKALQRDRHLDVVRRVALAHRQDRRARLGADCTRDHTSSAAASPGALPLAAAARLDAGEQALVVAGVVRDVAAAAQDRQDRLESCIGSSRATMSNAAEPPAVRMIVGPANRASRSQAIASVLHALHQRGDRRGDPASSRR
jgi:hypothetical protein